MPNLAKEMGWFMNKNRIFLYRNSHRIPGLLPKIVDFTPSPRLNGGRATIGTFHLTASGGIGIHHDSSNYVTSTHGWPTDTVGVMDSYHWVLERRCGGKPIP